MLRACQDSCTVPLINIASVANRATRFDPNAMLDKPSKAGSSQPSEKLARFEEPNE